MIVPVIDLAAILDPKASQEARDRVVEQVGAACRSIGFLVITNHGVPSSVIEGAFATSKDYFDLPLALKHQVAMSPEYPYGYENGEMLSKSREDKQNAKADLKETFQVCLGAEGQTPPFAPRWPEQPATFHEGMTAYYRALEKLAAQMLSVFALALELPDDWFADKIDRHMSSLRILNYPHQAQAPGTEQIRASAHTDYGSLTILAVDDAPGGLQVQGPDGQWEGVKAPPNSFIVNLGDLMARWTNDQWRSTMHRVVNPRMEELKESNRRQSIAFFYNINYDAKVECIPSCQSVENPVKYEPILAGEHLLLKHNAAQGHKVK